MKTYVATYTHRTRTIQADNRQAALALALHYTREGEVLRFVTEGSQ